MIGRSGKKRLTIEIRNKKIIFSIGTFDGTTVNIEKIFIKNIEFDVFKDGKLIDEENIAKIIKQTLKDKGVKVKECYLYISEAEIIKKTLVLPYIEDQKDFNDLIYTELSQILPIDLDNFIIKHKIISQPKNDNSKNLKISCVVLNKDVVYSYKNIIKLAGLKPKVLDMNSSALENLVKFIIMANSDDAGLFKREIENNSIAFIDMGTSSCSVAIFKGGSLDFTRIIKIPEIETEILNELENSTVINQIKNEETFELLNQILSEINMVFKYYTSSDRSNKIDEAFLCGEITDIKGFDKYIQDFLLMTVNNIDIIKGIDIKNPLNLNISEYIGVIGGQIRW